MTIQHTTTAPQIAAQPVSLVKSSRATTELRNNHLTALYGTLVMHRYLANLAG